MLGVTVASKTTLDYEFENGIIKMISGVNAVSSYLNMRSSMNGGATVRYERQRSTLKTLFFMLSLKAVLYFDLDTLNEYFNF